MTKNKKKFFFHSSGGWKAEFKVPADFGQACDRYKEQKVEVGIGKHDSHNRRAGECQPLDRSHLLKPCDLITSPKFLLLFLLPQSPEDWDFTWGPPCGDPLLRTTTVASQGDLTSVPSGEYSEVGLLNRTIVLVLLTEEPPYYFA